MACAPPTTMMDPPQKPFGQRGVSRAGQPLPRGLGGPAIPAAHWPDIAVLAGELKLPAFVAASLDEPESQRTLLSALAGGAARGAAFWPARIGFASGPEDIQRPEAYRRTRRSAVFLEMLPGRYPERPGGGHPGHWAARGCRCGPEGVGRLGQLGGGAERIEDIIGYLYHNRRCGCALTVFSELREVDPGLWEFIYQRPRVRVAWVAEHLLRCGSIEEFQARTPGEPAPRISKRLGEAGLWPHVVLPVSQANIRALPDLVLALIEGTRGASVEITPVSLVPTRPDSWRIFQFGGTGASSPSPRLRGRSRSGAAKARPSPQGA